MGEVKLYLLRDLPQNMEVQKLASKKVKSIVKLQIPAGKATPAPPVGSALGPHGINIVQFTREFNDRTAQSKDEGLIIPVVINQPNLLFIVYLLYFKFQANPYTIHFLHLIFLHPLIMNDYQLLPISIYTI